MTCITESQFSYSVHGNIGLDNKQTTLFVCKESYFIGDKQHIVSVECNYTEYKTRYSIGRIHKISLFVWRWLILCRKDGKVKVYEVLSTRYYIASVVELATRGQARLRNWFESNPCLSPSFYKERFPLSYKVELYYLPFLFMEEENESVCCSEQTKQVPIKEYAQKVWEFLSSLTDERISDVTVFQSRVTVTYTIL